MPKKNVSGRSRSGRAKPLPIRMHEGAKAFLRLAAHQVDAETLTDYVIEAIMEKASRDLGEAFTPKKNDEYVQRREAMAQKFPKSNVLHPQKRETT